MDKTKVEIIQETSDWYGADPSRRASRINDRGSRVCEYLSPNGNMCAAGRCIVDPQPEWEGTINNIYIPGMTAEDKVDVEWHFKKEYQGHDIEFWQDIQSLHDSEENWSETGISVVGQIEVEKLIARWQ